MATVTRTSGGSGANRWLVRIVIGIAVVGGFGLAAVMAVTWFGAVRGIEFSPDTFASRSFVYYEAPLVRVRVTPVYRQEVSGALQRQLKGSKDFLPQSQGGSPRWDVVGMFQGQSYYEDDAMIVYRFLNEEPFATEDALSKSLGEGAAAKRWREWTRNHPELAKSLWPAVAEACRGGFYTFTPELFFAAEQMTIAEEDAPMAEEFADALAQVMARQYTALAQIRRGDGKRDEAIELFSAALKHDAKFESALTGRAETYSAAGEHEKAKQDRQRLRELRRGD